MTAGSGDGLNLRFSCNREYSRIKRSIAKALAASKGSSRSADPNAPPKAFPQSFFGIIPLIKTGS